MSSDSAQVLNSKCCIGSAAPIDRSLGLLLRYLGAADLCLARTDQLAAALWCVAACSPSRLCLREKTCLHQEVCLPDRAGSSLCLRGEECKLVIFQTVPEPCFLCAGLQSSSTHRAHACRPAR